MNDIDYDESPEYRAMMRDKAQRIMAKARIKIYVREVTGKLPVFAKERNGGPDPYRLGQWFYVELHAREHVGWFGPLALGVVHVTDRRQPHLCSVVVIDNARRTGLGEMLVEAAGKKWPNVYWHGCDASRQFHARLVAKGIATQRGETDVYDFIPKEKRPAATFQPGGQ